MVDEHQGALTGRSSTIAILTDSGPIHGLLLTFLADYGPFCGQLLTILGSQSDFHD